MGRVKKSCKNCRRNFYRDSSSRRQYCSRCQDKVRARQVKEAHDREIIRNGGQVGVGTGGNQWRENNAQWNGGTKTYRDICLEVHDNLCALCSSSSNVRVHHIDGNRMNNGLDNLIPLCAPCHGTVHAIADKGKKKGRRS